MECVGVVSPFLCFVDCGLVDQGSGIRRLGGLISHVLSVIRTYLRVSPSVLISAVKLVGYRYRIPTMTTIENRAFYLQSTIYLCVSLGTKMTSTPEATPSRQPTFPLSTDEQICDFVKGICKEVDNERNKRKADVLKTALREGRDAVLKKARNLNGSKGSEMIENQLDNEYHAVYPRLPSNQCPSISNAPGLEYTKPKTRPITVRKRDGLKNSWKASQNIKPIEMEPIHDYLPPSTTTLFLKAHYAAEDNEELQFLPYFGDDDDENVISDYYDTKQLKKMMKDGPKHKALDTNECVDDVLRLIMKRAGDQIFDTQKKGSNSSERTALCSPLDHLAFIKKVDLNRIKQRFRACFPDVANCSPSRDNSKRPRTDSETSPSRTKKRSDSTNDPDEESSVTTIKKNSDMINHTDNARYEDVMDSYRTLFCRRCFTYDCNTHGLVPQPKIELQTALAIQKEKDGEWEDIMPEIKSEKKSDFQLLTPMCSLATTSIQVDKQNVVTTGSQKEDNIPYDKESNGKGVVDEKDKNAKMNRNSVLNPFQKVLYEHSMQIFLGEKEKAASVLNCSQEAINSQPPHDWALLPQIKLPVIDPNPKKKAKSKSMKSYNYNWLRRIENTSIRSTFEPCCHDEPCNDKNCPCVEDANFCTKHCVWGDRSRNFFRGCSCKGGQCTLQSCACYAAGRECDPDLCPCGAGTDPPGEPATNQRCRNDNIGMRRHTHVLVAKSTMKNAGWGLFNKYRLKKGK